MLRRSPYSALLALALALALAPALLPAPAAAQSTTGATPTEVAAGPGSRAPAVVTASPAPADAVDIPYRRFVLKNGLTLLVHEDHKAPIVAVNIWYHVGSKNEPEGRSGFAHLFEHLMFNGSENFDDEYFKPFERAGATDMNGTTNEDRTNYFENVPKTALDMALWMESDRMGHLVGAIDTAKVDEQRGVVQNEKRQGENQPYGRVFTYIAHNTYPVGHPYHHTVIGSMEDLNAASVADVKEWFGKYYGPSNAVLSIAGDVDAEAVKARVEKYFGDIPPGPPVDHQGAWIAKMSGTHRLEVDDRVPLARVYEVWNIPEWGSTDATYLDLVSDVLSSGKASRLYKRLVYDDQIATSVNAFASLSEIGGQFIIIATAKPGQDPAALEEAIGEEMDRFLADGPTADELARVKTGYRANFVRGIERIGGFGGKSDILARGEAFRGDPTTYKKQLSDVAGATGADLRKAARDWLSDGVFILTVHPFPSYAAGASQVDRSKGVPEPGAPPAPAFPALQTATLSNGLRVLLARRDAVPVVNFRLLFDAGYASDALDIPGTARLAMGMLDEGTESMDALQISEREQQLGARIGAGSDLDASFVTLSALQENLDPSLELFADILLRPSFPAAELERQRKQLLASITQEKSQPVTMALRLLPGLLYGTDHAYGNPLTGSGTEASIAKIDRAGLQAFHDTWLVPNNATLVVVGPLSMDELKPKLERLFSGWKKGSVPHKQIGHVDPPARPTIYLVDKPGSPQSLIFAGEVAPPKANPNEVPIQMMNTVLGGSFTSRVNMNLREDKHWSYGAQTLLLDATGQRPFILYAPVQTDKTAESIREALGEFQGIVGPKPVTADELTKVKDRATRTLPGRWETSQAVAGDISELVEFGLPMDYWSSYPDRVRSVTLEQANAAAREVVRPGHMIWVVVGDRAKIEAPIRALDVADVKTLTMEGQVGSE
jgi:zinc protease